MTAKRISPSRRRWLDRQREAARQEREALGVPVPGKSKWAYSTRSDSRPKQQ